jgi:hypothetical protein
MLGDASMVLSLEQIQNIEDKNLLAGHMMVLLERDVAVAQVIVESHDDVPREGCSCGEGYN